MKGLSLAINSVVIITIAILVLLALGSFFVLNWNQSAGTLSDTEALQDGCAVWKARGCKLGDYSTGHLIPDITISNYGTLRAACQEILITTPLADTAENNCRLALECQEYCCGSSEYSTIGACVASIS